MSRAGGRARSAAAALCVSPRAPHSPPRLVAVLNSEPEIQYVALRNINLIVQKRPAVLENEIKVFFCKYNDPIYVKMEKLEIIIRLVSGLSGRGRGIAALS